MDEGKAVDVVCLDLSKASDTNSCSILLRKSGQVKPQFESRANTNCREFKAIEYRIQVVAGTMYFIKVQVSDANYVHLKVFQRLPYENQGPSLADFQTGKTRDDPLTYF
ncbi:cystatin-A-like isoform X1 [Chamaea fasciata]|uniref:cystatin-A-like isoform X1 n=1 Tax=Chamaea fasciata TaxID=190680 RepID=UPI00336A430A